MIKENISPEERLFSIIQKNKGLTSTPTGEYNDKSKKLKLDLKSLGLVRRLIMYRMQAFFGNLKNKIVLRKDAENAISIALPIKFQEIDFRVVNKILSVIVVFLTIFFIYYTITNKPNVARIINAISGIKAQVLKKKDIETFKPLNFYVEEIRKKDIFSPASSESIGSKTPYVPSGLRELAKNLSLVGIYMGMYPEAMVEDKTEKKTYFLKQGNEIKGLKVKEILPDRIILEYKGEEMEFM